MVGDGINDVPALARPTSAVPSGAGPKRRSGHSEVARLSHHLQGVPAAVGMARSTLAVILQNFGWAMGYNSPLSPWPLSGCSTRWWRRCPWASPASSSS